MYTTSLPIEPKITCNNDLPLYSTVSVDEIQEGLGIANSEETVQISQDMEIWNGPVLDLKLNLRI